MSTAEDSSTSDNSYEDLILFSSYTRTSFLWLFIVITVLSLTGNCAAVYSISKRNYRIFQKTCIISLALSDILGTISIATININDFISEAMTWPLGSFLCAFVPMCQMTGILASSIALMVIAMDRYRNVVFALAKRWNPRLSFCLIGTAFVWLACFGVSYPMYSFFELKHFPTADGKTLPCCLMFVKKEMLQNYYITMVLVIFLPLFIVFLWFYYNIASLVWKHRKPLSTIFNKAPSRENTSSSSKNFTEIKNLKKPKTQEDIRVERKLRTFRIIIVLMVVFIVCRLPYFTIQLMKTVKNSDIADREETWYLLFTFMALHIINCILNPLLYTFLNLTLKIWFKFESFVLEICCFCCSKREFESFERENPFAIGDFNEKRNSKVRFEDEKRY